MPVGTFHAGGSVASTSPPATARASAPYIYEPSFVTQSQEIRPDRPLDPGGAGPQLPGLRAGGSTPPRAKFRQMQAAPDAAHPGNARVQHGQFQPSPRSEISSVHALGSARQSPGRGERSANPIVPAIPHWERRADANAQAQAANASANSAAMWGAIASAVAGDGQSLPWEQHAFTDSSHSFMPSSARGVRNIPAEAMAQRAAHVEAQHAAPPLRSAMQQLQGVSDELSQRQPSARRGRGVVGGGAHAGAGSPSPDSRPRQDERPQGTAQEDKYLKILQSLQAKGAVNGGLAAQLLEKQGAMLPRSASASRRASSKQVISSDSDSSDDSGKLRLRGRRRMA